MPLGEDRVQEPTPLGRGADQEQHLVAWLSGIAQASRTALRQRRGRISLGLLLALGASLPGLSSMGWLWRSASVRSAASPHAPLSSGAHVLAGDTVFIWGPRLLNGSGGQGQTYVETFTTAPSTTRLYTLHLLNGNTNGTQRASKVTVTLNGLQVVAATEVTQAVGQLDRVVAITSVDTIRVTVAGSGSPFITLSVLSTASIEYVAFGPKQYIIPSGTTYTLFDNFTVTTAGTTGRVYVTNGAPDGTGRVTSASILLNGTSILSTMEFKNTVGSLTRPVALRNLNSFSYTLNGPTNSFITVYFTAPDEWPPTVTITSPAAGAVGAGAGRASNTV